MIQKVISALKWGTMTLVVFWVATLSVIGADKNYVRVSKANPHYFELTDGTPYIPIGVNLCLLRGYDSNGELHYIDEDDKGFQKMEFYFKQLADNGGNYARIWLSSLFFEPERERIGQYDPKILARLQRVLDMASKYNIRLKLCFEHFRQINPKEPGARPFFTKTLYFSNPPSTISQFVKSEEGKRYYLDRCRIFAKHFKDHPAVFGWELWNEVNCIPQSIEWTEKTLPEIRKMFPKHLVMQSMGSYDVDRAEQYYKPLVLLKGNDVAQIHRYLDPGASLDVCRGPMDRLGADMTKTILAMNSNKPVLATEMGAVEWKHAGPSKLYLLDKEGILLHDILFAPFFCGAAGSGHCWHWYQYIEKNNLWWHIGRFSKSIAGVNPIKEEFVPFETDESFFHVYGLRGKTVSLLWLRSQKDNWKTELVDKVAPETFKNFDVTLPPEIASAGKSVTLYDPWLDKETVLKIEKGKVRIPAMKRSAVLRITYSSQEKGNVSEKGVKKFAVETVGGVPMITLDGVPVRSRVFWGRTDGNLAIDTTPKKQMVDFEYIPRLDAKKNGTIHFRFGYQPGTVVIDDFSIVEEKSGIQVAGPYSFESKNEYADHWKAYNMTAKNKTVAKVEVKPTSADPKGSLVITIHKAQESIKADFHVYHKHELDMKPQGKYRIRFTISSDVPRTVGVAFYRPDNPHVSLGGTPSRMDSHMKNQVKMAADVGVNFVSFLYRGCWKTEDGNWDWTALDDICDMILAANPNALLIPRPEMNAPKWWLDRNPDERMIWKNDRKFTLTFGRDWASPASEKYRAAACEALAAMINHLEKKYGSSMAGYHPYGQNTGEWFMVNTWGGGFTGFGVAEGRSWRKWLEAKYGTDAQLQKAWGNDQVTLKTAEVPSVALRRASMTTPVLDPKVDPRCQSMIDFNIWTQKAMTDTILALAKTIRETTKGQKLSVFFYGYSFEFSGVAKGPAASAHYNIRALLESPDIDIICSPISYFDRQPGGGCACMLTAESVSESGKMYLYEDDTRTFLVRGNNFPGFESGSDSLTITRHLLLRNTAESAVRNFGAWWMDLGGTGWFEDSRLWEVMSQLEKMDEYFLKNPTPYRPEIGVFLDEASVLKISAGKYSLAMIGQTRRPLNRLGAPYGQYLLDDLLNGKIQPPKLCIVLNPKCLTESQRAKIAEVTKNVTLLYVDFEGLTLESLKTNAQKAKVHLYTQESCNVWANGPYIVLHGAEDGPVHFTAPWQNGICDALSGKNLSKTNQLTLPLKKGETRVLMNSNCN